MDILEGGGPDQAFEQGLALLLDGWPAAWSRAARARLLAGTPRKHAMIDHATLLTYLAVLTGFVLIPGPAVLLTLARAATSARAWAWRPDLASRPAT